MKLPIYQIDAFTDTVFKGNSACVIPLQAWLPDNIMLNIAKENAVAETAFFVRNRKTFGLRWFTPDVEMDLCGHATLATAHAIKTILGETKDEIIFETTYENLSVSVDNDRYTMNFPSRIPFSAQLPENIRKSLNIPPKEVLKARDFVLVYESESDIKKLKINRQLFDQMNIDPGGVVATAKGSNCDFVSRFFTPQSTILEDPVTGSAHCSLIPFWSEKLNKNKMIAIQLSERQGKLFCENMGSRVLIGGMAKTYLTGEIEI